MYWRDFFDKVLPKRNVYWYEAMPKGRKNWVTKDGRVVALSDMDETHLRNAIAMLTRIAIKNNNYNMPLTDMLDYKRWKRCNDRHKRAMAWADYLQDELNRRRQ